MIPVLFDCTIRGTDLDEMLAATERRARTALKATNGEPLYWHKAKMRAVAIEDSNELVYELDCLVLTMSMAHEAQKTLAHLDDVRTTASLLNAFREED